MAIQSVYRHQGKWMYDFQKNGIRYQKSGYPTKQDAKNAEVEARKKIGKINTDFVKLCESRLDDVKSRRTDKYYRSNKAIIKRLIIRWGDKKEITRDDIEEYLKETIEKGKGAANDHLRIIKALFNHGVEREWFTYNPAGKIKPFPAEHQIKYVPPVKDVMKVLSLAKPIDRLYLALTVQTIARINEINKLKWDDVFGDFLILRTRKSKNSNIKERVIPLNKTGKEIIKEIPKKGDFVFTNPKTQKAYGYRDKILDTLCKRAGVRRFTYHCLRHLGSSLMADKGEPLPAIQAILGHERATTTDIYLRSLGKGIVKATKKLEGIK